MLHRWSEAAEVLQRTTLAPTFHRELLVFWDLIKLLRWKDSPVVHRVFIIIGACIVETNALATTQEARVIVCHCSTWKDSTLEGVLLVIVNVYSGAKELLCFTSPLQTLKTLCCGRIRLSIRRGWCMR